MKLKKVRFKEGVFREGYLIGIGESPEGDLPGRLYLIGPEHPQKIHSYGCFLFVPDDSNEEPYLLDMNEESEDNIREEIYLLDNLLIPDDAVDALLTIYEKFQLINQTHEAVLENEHCLGEAFFGLCDILLDIQQKNWNDCQTLLTGKSCPKDILPPEAIMLELENMAIEKGIYQEMKKIMGEKTIKKEEIIIKNYLYGNGYHIGKFEFEKKGLEPEILNVYLMEPNLPNFPSDYGKILMTSERNKPTPTVIMTTDPEEIKKILEKLSEPSISTEKLDSIAYSAQRFQNLFVAYNESLRCIPEPSLTEALKRFTEETKKEWENLLNLIKKED